MCLVGHHGAGKTALAEALLAVTGTIPRLGSVEKGTTVCDFEPEEIQRQLSVSLAIAPFELDGIKVNLLDVPGLRRLLRRAGHRARGDRPGGRGRVSATDGVQGQTEDAWRAAAALGLPRMIVITKLDRERADFARVLDEVRRAFGAGVAPVELPDRLGGLLPRGDRPARRHRHPLRHLGARRRCAGRQGPIPDDLANEEHEVHEQLVEGIVVGDDDLMTRYLEGETIERAELQKALASGVASGSVFPVLCASAITGVGIDRLANLLVELAPPADHRYPVEVLAGDTTTEVVLRPGRAAAARGVQDAVGPARRPDLAVQGGVGDHPPRRRARPTPGPAPRSGCTCSSSCAGTRHSPVTEAVAGDFVAVPRLAGTKTGDTLAPKGTPVSFPLPNPDPPALQAAVKPSSRADEDKLMSSLQRLGRGGPVHLGDPRSTRPTRPCSARPARSTSPSPSSASPASTACTSNARTSSSPTARRSPRAPRPRAATRSRPAATASSAWCTSGSSRSSRGEGFQFHDEVVGGAIPRQYIPAVEKGVLEAMEQGGKFGYPVVDVSVTCDDGKFHSVDSSEMSFKMAGAPGVPHRAREGRRRSSSSRSPWSR